MVRNTSCTHFVSPPPPPTKMFCIRRPQLLIQHCSHIQRRWKFPMYALVVHRPEDDTNADISSTTLRCSVVFASAIVQRKEESAKRVFCATPPIVQCGLVHVILHVILQVICLSMAHSCEVPLPNSECQLNIGPTTCILL